ncbi:virulence RhuM family protein [Canibacter sp. lx-45]|uniref:virulence RhuM family protein n=1 Tax=Canibacter zhuwentaonis TaxID=2837491 RepID=UPI001BDBE9FA|nr:virulence RhuM family protein [Canibacter zhuwentaonis]MBT1035398.1 virulence RhuM family protein [Canibacter zhuwentaonis]
MSRSFDSRKLIKHSSARFLTFTANEEFDIEIRYEADTIWLTQKLMAQLFDINLRTVNEHIRNIFRSGELAADSVIRKFRITAKDGKSYLTQHYNLDAIISVGYRVNSVRATQFRQWATRILRDFTLRGYVIDRERMEQGEILGVDYFEQLLQEIREIRLSERRFYQKVTDIYATAVDYDKDAPTTRKFFTLMQNKLHFAVHGHTAAEVIRQRANADQPHMGLTSWKNAPDGKIIRSDVTIGENYLTPDELADLDHLVEAYLNLGESRAKRHIPTTMEEWIAFLDRVIKLDARELLVDAGKITKEIAHQHAIKEYDKFRIEQDANHVSDFDAFNAAAQQAIARKNREQD